MALATSVFRPVQSGAAGWSLLTERLPNECGVRQLTPGAVVVPVTRSEIMKALESHTTKPPLFELNETPVRSTLEFTSARIPGPVFCQIVPPRRNATELPIITGQFCESHT